MGRASGRRRRRFSRRARRRAHGVGFSAGWTIVRRARGGDRRDASRRPVGLGGPPATVDAVVAALGRTVTARMDERLVPARRTRRAARGRRARHGSRATPMRRWLRDWYTAFVVEAFGRLHAGFDAEELVQRGLSRSRCWIWTDGDGRPCSMAVAHPPVDGVSRIGPVYTPPDAARSRLRIGRHRCRVARTSSTRATLRACTPTWPTRRRTRSTSSSATARCSTGRRCASTDALERQLPAGERAT